MAGTDIAPQDDDATTAQLVREILEEARRAVGGGPSFAARLSEHGVGPETGHYSQSAVSNWIKGRTMPPADVLLAAAQIAGISLDDRLAITATTSRSEEDWQTAVDDLQAQIDGLRAEMLNLAARLGHPLSESGESTPATRRQASAG